MPSIGSRNSFRNSTPFRFGLLSLALGLAMRALMPVAAFQYKSVYEAASGFLVGLSIGLMLIPLIKSRVC
jgi:hypothetical protein